MVYEGKAASANGRILDTKSEFKDGKLDSLSPLVQPPKCPECASQRIWKDGLRYVKTDTGEMPTQRYLCRNCGYRFSLNGSKTRSEPLKKPSRWSINNASAYTLGRQVCEFLTEGSKNLIGVESRLEKAAGATKLSKEEIAGKIVEYMWFMKQEGYRAGTIESYTDRIKTLLNKGANLWDADAVKRLIASVPTWNDGSKKCFSDAYDVFVRMEGLTWNKPHYKPRSKIPFIPTEKELDQLIHGCGKKMRAFLQGLKETGADPGELFAIEWIDIDFNRSKLAINHPVKYHNPRILNVSDEWLRMVSKLPRTSEKVWGNIKYESNYNNLNAQRKRLAREYDNPRLKRVTFTTFRHWKGTMIYHQTHDCMQVKEQLGHKSLISTQIYIHLDEKLFQQLNNEFIVRRAVSIKGMMTLAAVGFEKFDQVGDVHLYRKPKDGEEL